ncbi:MAG: hypothetical protein ACLUDU_04580 [Butyricimonas faecihominis]
MQDIEGELMLKRWLTTKRVRTFDESEAFSILQINDYGLIEADST